MCFTNTCVVFTEYHNLREGDVHLKDELFLNN